MFFLLTSRSVDTPLYAYEAVKQVDPTGVRGGATELDSQAYGILGLLQFQLSPACLFTILLDLSEMLKMSKLITPPWSSGAAAFFFQENKETQIIHRITIGSGSQDNIIYIIHNILYII